MEFLKLDYQLAYDAYRNTSFDPERRAKTQVDGFEDTLKEVYEEAKSLVKTDEQMAVLDESFNKFQNGLLKKKQAHLYAKSRCLSAMITGPANFPTRRNQKALDSEHKRAEEFLSYFYRGVEIIKRNVKKALSGEELKKEQKAVEEESYNYIIREAASVIADAVQWGRHNTLLKSALQRKIVNKLSHNGELMEKAVNEINEASKEKTGKNMFTKRHSIFKIIEQTKAPKVEPEVKEDKVLFENDLYRLEIHYSDERYRFFFDGKPSDEIRSIMKSNGFKWSPRACAWQRKNTYNGKLATEVVMSQLKNI